MNALPPEARDPRPALESALRLVSLGMHLAAGNRTDLPYDAARGAGKDKRPAGNAWGRPGNTITTPDQVHRAFTRAARQVHVVLGPSGLASLDVDDEEETRVRFKKEGLDFDAIVGAHPHPIRGQGIRYPFLVPEDIDLPGVRMCKHREGRGNAFEIRAAPRDGSVEAQDLAPGSWHKGAGRLYIWGGRGAPERREDIPVLPPELLALYDHLGTRQARPRPEPPPLSARPMTPSQGGALPLKPLGSVASGQRPTRKVAPGQALDTEDVRAWVNANHDMEELLRGYGYRIEGRRAQCVLPGHADHTPSCSYSSEHIYCHVCQQRTDIVGLVALREGITYRAAVLHLGYVPPSSAEESQRRKEFAGRPVTPRCPPQDYGALLSYAHTALLHGEDPVAAAARLYLERRGFGPDAWEHLGFGVIDASVPAEWLPRYWSEEGRLVTFPRWQEMWHGRILIPDGRPDGTSVKGRANPDVTPDQRKYIHAPGFQPAPYNAMAAATMSGPLLLVEGELDAATVMCTMPEQAVAGLPGIRSFTPGDAETLRVQGRRVYVIVDTDAHLLRAVHLNAETATERGAVGVTQVLKGAGADVWLVPAALEGSKDLNDAWGRWSNSFPDRLRQLLTDYARPLDRRRRIY